MPDGDALVDVTDRETAITAIRTALRERSGKAWSVRGGRGTAYGWIRIAAPPARCDELGRMTAGDIVELSQLLDKPVHWQGQSVPASGDYRREYVARAQGKVPEVYGTPYWD